ncbi:amylosucrase [Maribacter sp. 2210JD10-5]|uniref:amylosucrase n=1 Tax=Maribacter sp. 2210JD10-5 TaxID=3386272 RepID=UPI0039BD5C20
MNQAALHRLLAAKYGSTKESDLFQLRLAANLSLIKTLFFSLYSSPEHKTHFHGLLDKLEVLYKKRPDALKKQDIERLNSGNWYQSEQLVGMQLYVNRFNGDLKGLNNKLNYFESLGINFLHLMPVTTRPKGENDGGYAVNSYHKIDPKYGSKKDFLALAEEARSKNILLMLDFVVNHTSDEFQWAQKAKSEDKKYQNYYYTYQNREIPDAFEKTLPEIFPETAPGSFTYNAQMDRWVMTCFNSYQWDLNYTNPAVFIEMLENLMVLANLGVDVIRFDALAFLWKKIGTISQNLNEAHELVALFRMCLQVIAPGVILLAEAIVAPRNILKYFGENTLEGNECEIAYNASLMALIWNSIATKKTNLLVKSLLEIPNKPKDATWINYVRCHDDIGLGYDDDFIRAMGWNPQSHRKFLLDYYSGKLDWSPAKGLLFMYNPKNGDGRITGSTASLLGLETALSNRNESEVTFAIAKILLVHGIILSYGGIPMIYAGDEIGTLNDYSFKENKDHRNDSRWVNRPMHDWDTVKKIKTDSSPQKKIYEGLKRLIKLRKKLPVLADTNNLIIHPDTNPHLLIYERRNGKESILIISNVDEHTQYLEIPYLFSKMNFKIDRVKELIHQKPIEIENNILILKPYQQLWLQNR